MHAYATASESTGITGSLERYVSVTSLSNSDNSSMGVACVEPASAAVASLAPVCSSPCSRVVCAAGAVHARRTVSPIHAASNSGGTGGLLPLQSSTRHCMDKSWSDTVSLQGPRERKRGKEEVTGPAEDLRRVSEVESKFSAGRRCTEAGCRFTSRKATRHR